MEKVLKKMFVSDEGLIQKVCDEQSLYTIGSYAKIRKGKIPKKIDKEKVRRQMFVRDRAAESESRPELESIGVDRFSWSRSRS